MSTFADQIKLFKRKTEAKMLTVTHSFVREIGGQLILRSPRGKWDKWTDAGKSWNPKPPYSPGEFAGSWQFTAGAMDSTYNPTVDATGRLSAARFSQVNAHPAAGRYTLYHLSPQSLVMELGHHPLIENWSLLPPNADGVVRKTLDQAPRILAGIVRRLA